LLLQKQQAVTFSIHGKRLSSAGKKLLSFSALTLLVGRQKTQWWDTGMVICLGWDADLHMAQLMPLPFTISCSSKSRLALPEWFCFSGAGLPRLSGKKGH